MKNFFDRYIKNNFYANVFYNILLVMLLFMACRVAFYLFNVELFGEMTFSHFLTLCKGGLQFDLTAVLYTNILYFVMMLIPFGFRRNSVYQKFAKWLFIITSSIAIIVNCADIYYFPFTFRRTTMSVFSEFSNEGNLIKIFALSMIEHWGVTLFALTTLLALWFFYHTPRFSEKRKTTLLYYVLNTAAVVAFAAFFVIAARGGMGAYVRPITLSNANVYADKPNETAIVLNTPFCIYRTIGQKSFKDPQYFKTDEELNAVFNPIVYPADSGDFKKMNVVIFIIESLSKEFVGELNKDLDSGAYKGYTPFLDSLIREGLTFEYTFANGRKSIDGMPSVLASIPMFYEPYFLTSYSTNKVSGIAGELDKKGYYTAFFHGAPNGSMGFEAFAKASGFKDYFGMNEYDGDKKVDFDGTWALWDEEFFQFYARKMDTFQQPFMTALFSASSHHPFVVPEKYNSRFPEEGSHPIHKCTRYTDFSLQRFFETARKEAWFQNTVFVITADHTNALTRKEYLNDAGFYKVPIVFYTPKGDLHGRIKKIAQQIDIMPTVLSYLNYEEPFVAFGKNLLDSTQVDNAIAYNNPVFQYFEGNYMYQFNEQKIFAVYDFVNDFELKNNLIGKIEINPAVENRIKAYIQQYVERMTNNNLTVQ
ncbi:sulfatase [Bacteroidia bacterium]|nr:sulfatase [Bacteroidia bacterium]